MKKKPAKRHRKLSPKARKGVRLVTGAKPEREDRRPKGRTTKEVGRLTKPDRPAPTERHPRKAADADERR